jgi:hypothetical protein
LTGEVDKRSAISVIGRTKDQLIHPTTALRPTWLVLAVSAFALATPSCTLLDRGQPLVPTRHQVRSGPFLIFSNSPIADEPQAVNCLQALERDLGQHLDFHPSAQSRPVEIYVLDDRNSFAHFLKFYFPELPPRRAFFLAQDQQRVVYTYSSPRLEEDLRHEATHALLHGSFGALPLWLDEGLAEYFETDLSRPGSERERIELIQTDLAGGWSPDLARLQSLTEIRQMTPRDYREAWAWVHLLLNGSPRARPQLRASLAEFGTRPDRAKLDQRLAEAGATNERLLPHLKALDSRTIAAKQPQNAPSIRLQNYPFDPAPQSGDSRGFLRRIRDWMGF